MMMMMMMLSRCGASSRQRFSVVMCKLRRRGALSASISGSMPLSHFRITASQHLCMDDSPVCCLVGGAHHVTCETRRPLSACIVQNISTSLSDPPIVSEAHGNQLLYPEHRGGPGYGGFPKVGVPFLWVSLRGFYSIGGIKEVPLFLETPKMCRMVPSV